MVGTDFSWLKLSYSLTSSFVCQRSCSSYCSAWRYSFEMVAEVCRGVVSERVSEPPPRHCSGINANTATASRVAIMGVRVEISRGMEAERRPALM